MPTRRSRRSRGGAARVLRETFGLTHLRRIREKTGCKRMADLIRKLNDPQVPLRLD